MSFSRTFSLTAAMVLVLTALCGCGDGNSSSTLSGVSSGQKPAVDTPAVGGDAALGSDSSQKSAVDTPAVGGDAALGGDSSQKPAEVPEGAVLKLGDITASPGEIVEIPLSVTGTGEGWALCGLHITYPDTLKPVMIDEEETTVKYKPGDASEYKTSSICMEWRDNKTDYLIDNKLGCIFFTEMFDGNGGTDGEIARFFFEVPLNAKSGDVYPLDFYYQESDLFMDDSLNTAYQALAFENWQGGTLTIN